MPRSDHIAYPFIRRGDVITAERLNILATRGRVGVTAVGQFQNGGMLVSAPAIGGGGTTTTTPGGSANIKIVLIDDDIDPGIDEKEPVNFLLPADIPLTDIEIDAGYTKVFQDPPDDDYTQNIITPAELNRFQYKRVKVPLKVFTSGKKEEGTVADTTSDDDKVILEDGASSVTDYYKGEVITLTDVSGETSVDQVRNVIAYDGPTRTITVDEDWDLNPTTSTTYSVTANANLMLAHTVIDDLEGLRKIVRYTTIDVWYDDGRPFNVGEYKRSDFPDYPENSAFPPANLPEGFLKRRFRGIVINNILVTALCQPLPAPELPE